MRSGSCLLISKPDVMAKKKSACISNPPPLPQERKWVLLRSLFHWGFVISYWLAAQSVPFGTATALVYTGPLLTIAIAALLRRERVPRVFAAIAPVSLAGVILVTQPSAVFGDTRNALIGPAGVAYALVAALCLAALPLVTNSARGAHWLQIEHTSTFLGGFVLTPLAIVAMACVGRAVDPGVIAVCGQGSF